jgi:hypothetical protein
MERRQVQYDGIHCILQLEQLAERVILMTISGSDIGEFGDAPMRTLEEWCGPSAPVELFIDARNVRGASIDVSGDWAKWLAGHKFNLSAVTMLPGSRLVQITAEFVRRFAELDMMRICVDAPTFDGALDCAVHSNDGMARGA